MFNKLVEQGISEDILGSIKLLDSKVKFKISNNNICVNVNYGVLQGSYAEDVPSSAFNKQ